MPVAWTEFWELQPPPCGTLSSVTRGPHPIRPRTSSRWTDSVRNLDVRGWRVSPSLEPAVNMSLSPAALLTGACRDEPLDLSCGNRCPLITDPIHAEPERAAMVTMKDAVPRRVWRMTSDSPAGEYLELVPKAASANGAESGPRAELSITAGPLRTPARVAGLPPTAPAAVSASQANCRDAPAPTRVKVLRPAQVENWQSSSFDLLSGRAQLGA